MLVLSRHISEAVIVIDRATMTFIGFAGLVDGRGSRARIGFSFGNNYLIQRQENTSLTGLTFTELQKVPVGTKVELLASKDR